MGTVIVWMFGKLSTITGVFEFQKTYLKMSSNLGAGASPEGQKARRCELD